MIGIIADDLTGAGDAGLHFADAGLSTVIQVFQEGEYAVEQNIPEVYIINTDSRFDDPKKAYDKVKNASRQLKAMGVTSVFKKIDSTLRGNIGAEIDALFDEFDIEVLPFCAAFPDMGRTTVNGHLLVYDKLVTQTEFATDSRNPVLESHIPTLLANQTKNSDFIIVCEASSRDDVKEFVKEISRSELEVVVGSAGFAKELVEAWTGRKPRRKSIKNSSLKKTDTKSLNPVLLISGSRNGTTYSQIEKLSSISEIMFVPVDFSENKVKLANWLDTSGTADSMEKSQGKSMLIFALSKSKQLDPRRVMNILSQLAGTLCKKGLFRKLILAGGDTAVNVCRVLNIGKLRLLRSVLPGMALCSDMENRYSIILKPGSFGDEDALVKCYGFLKEEE